MERMQQGDCTYCPPNANENENGHHSAWGRKVAAKHKYATGKGRKEINWHKYGPWSLCDRHYDPDYQPGGAFYPPIYGTHYYW